MKSKLILVEGLPCVGKSTIAKTIDVILSKMDVRSNLFLEGNLDHPSDYEGVAYIEKTEFKQLLEEFSEYSVLIEEMVEVKEDYILFSYVKAKKRFECKFPDELFELLRRKDIYELPLSLHIKLITNKWKEFVQTAKKQDTTYIFDCSFIQNPLTVSMIRSGSSKDIIAGYIEKLAQIVQELNPILIYVERKDIKDSFYRVMNERPKEWLLFFIDYYTSQGYGKLNNLSGFEGTIEILKRRKELEMEIINNLTIDKFYIDNSNYKLEEVEAEIVHILKNYI